MKKTQKYLLLLIFFLFLTTPVIGIAHTKTGKCGISCRYFLDTDQKSLRIYGTGSMYDSGATQPWAQGNDYAKIETIIIEEGITGVGSEAFINLINLETVLLPSTLKSIHYSVFYGCPKRIDIYFTGDAPQILDEAFYGTEKIVAHYPCTNQTYTSSIKNNYYGNDVSWIDDNHNLNYIEAKAPTYSECGNINCFVCDQCNKIFKDSSCEKELDNYVIPAISDMNVLCLPEQIKQIDYKAFAHTDCQAVIIPSGCITIDEYAFYDCRNLIYVKIPSSVKNIPKNAFSNCNDKIFIDWDNE